LVGSIRDGLSDDTPEGGEPHLKRRPPSRHEMASSTRRTAPRPICIRSVFRYADRSADQLPVASFLFWVTKL
jgi:hypothetical protein